MVEDHRLAGARGNRGGGEPYGRGRERRRRKAQRRRRSCSGSGAGLCRRHATVVVNGELDEGAAEQAVAADGPSTRALRGCSPRR